jgi:hypothetical protein
MKTFLPLISHYFTYYQDPLIVSLLPIRHWIPSHQCLHITTCCMVKAGLCGRHVGIMTTASGEYIVARHPASTHTIGAFVSRTSLNEGCEVFDSDQKAKYF